MYVWNCSSDGSSWYRGAQLEIGKNELTLSNKKNEFIPLSLPTENHYYNPVID